jgi:hypothetical protein
MFIRSSAAIRGHRSRAQTPSRLPGAMQEMDIGYFRFWFYTTIYARRVDPREMSWRTRGCIRDRGKLDPFLFPGLFEERVWSYRLFVKHVRSRVNISSEVMKSQVEAIRAHVFRYRRLVKNERETSNPKIEDYDESKCPTALPEPLSRPCRAYRQTCSHLLSESEDE